ASLARLSCITSSSARSRRDVSRSRSSSSSNDNNRRRRHHHHNHSNDNRVGVSALLLRISSSSKPRAAGCTDYPEYWLWRRWKQQRRIQRFRALQSSHPAHQLSAKRFLYPCLAQLVNDDDDNDQRADASSSRGEAANFLFLVTLFFFSPCFALQSRALVYINQHTSI
ncbi:unnamed protein product, partial [Ectocarpus sp. 4 AP-2014]